MLTEEQKRERHKIAKAKYDKKTKELVLRFRLNQDGDVIKRLDEVPNKTEYVRNLVRQDIKDG